MSQGCGSKGMITSPNYPDDYPFNLEKTETIQVEEGLILDLEFDAFNIQFDNRDFTCLNDHLTITDGDGTTLMEKSCGPYTNGSVSIGGQSIGSGSLPPAIRSRSSTIKLVFTTDGYNGYGRRTGWSVSWRAVAG